MLHKVYGDELVLQPYIMSVDELNAKDTAGTCLWLKSCAQLATRRVCSDLLRHQKLAAWSGCTCCFYIMYILTCCFQMLLGQKNAVTPAMLMVTNNNKISDNNKSNDTNDNKNSNNNNTDIHSNNDDN